MSNKSSISERFKEIRNMNNLSQREFAEKIGYSSSIISEIERGTNEPSRNVMLAIHRCFNVNLHWLLLGEGNMMADDMIDHKDKKIEELEKKLAEIDIKNQNLIKLNKELKDELIESMRQIINLQQNKLSPS